MTYIGDEKRLEYLARKAQRRNITPEGLVAPSMTWEDHLEIEAIRERRARSVSNGERGSAA